MPVMIRIAVMVWLLGVGVLATQAVWAQTPAEGIGPKGKYNIVRTYSRAFWVYDAGQKMYVPYLPDRHAAEPAISAFVNIESNRHYQLLVYSRQDASLFINSALCANLKAGRWRVLAIDSLYRLYQRPELFLTLYGSAGADGYQLYVATPRQGALPSLGLQHDNLSVRPRLSATTYSNFLGIALVVLLGYLAFLYTLYRPAFFRFFSLKDLLTLRIQDETFLVNRPLNSINLLFLAALGLIISYLILLLHSKSISLFGGAASWGEQRQFGWLWGWFLVVAIGTFLVLIAKYIVVELVTGLYQLRQITDVYYFKILQSSLLFYGTLTILLTLLHFNAPGLFWSENVLFYTLIIFYTGRLLLLYALVQASEPIKNLYLFSYLCLAEVIPVITAMSLAF